MKKENPLFKTTLKTTVKGWWPPFALSTLMLAGIIALFFYNYSRYIYDGAFFQKLFLLLGIVFLVEIVVYRWRLPSSQLLIFKNEAEQLRLEIWNDQLLTQSFQIAKIDYWWNYKFSGGINTGVANYKMPYKRGTTRAGDGPANRLNLYVSVMDEMGNSIALTDIAQVWETTPEGWGYRLDVFSEKERVIKVKRLKKLVPIVMKDLLN